MSLARSAASSSSALGRLRLPRLGLLPAPVPASAESPPAPGPSVPCNHALVVLPHRRREHPLREVRRRGVRPHRRRTGLDQSRPDRSPSRSPAAVPSTATITGGGVSSRQTLAPRAPPTGSLDQRPRRTPARVPVRDCAVPSKSPSGAGARRPEQSSTFPGSSRAPFPTTRPSPSVIVGRRRRRPPPRRRRPPARRTGPPPPRSVPFLRPRQRVHRAPTPSSTRHSPNSRAISPEGECVHGDRIDPGDEREAPRVGPALHSRGAVGDDSVIVGDGDANVPRQLCAVNGRVSS